MDEKKAVTMYQLLESARQGEALTMQVAQAAQAELNKRPTTEQVNAAVAELFTSVSDGKALIASAITDKGVATAQDASFQTMRENILAIESGGGLPEGVYQISLSASTAEGGTVSGGGVASEGMTLTVAANVADGYNFEGWQENGEVVSTDNSYTFVVVGSRVLTAVFVSTVTMYTVTASIDPSGAGTVTGAGQYQEGATATITATPAEGYTFGGWYAEKLSRLPSGYTELEYIQSTGTQYINSDHNPTYNCKVVIKINSSTQNDSFFGSQHQWQVASYSLGTNTATFANLATQGISINDGKDHVCEYSKDGLFVDGTLTWNAMLGKDFTGGLDYPMYILANNERNVTVYQSHAKLYYCQVYENGLLVRGFIPCKNASGEIGLYDEVSGKFYGNDGAGTFEAGPEITHGELISDNASYTFAVTGNRAFVAWFAEESQGRLPSGYTEVEYIQTSALGYLLTGITPNISATRIESKWMVDEIPSSAGGIFGGRMSTGFYFVTAKSATILNYRFQSATGGTKTMTVPNTIGKDITIDVNYPQKQIIINGSSASMGTVNAPSGDLRLFCIGSYSETYKFLGKCYYFKVYDGSSLVADFVPCLDTSGHVGMYDLVSGSFKTGYGGFIAGPAV